MFCVILRNQNQNKEIYMNIHTLFDKIAYIERLSNEIERKRYIDALVSNLLTTDPDLVLFMLLSVGRHYDDVCENDVAIQFDRSKRIMNSFI